MDKEKELEIITHFSDKLIEDIDQTENLSASEKRLILISIGSNILSSEWSSLMVNIGAKKANAFIDGVLEITKKVAVEKAISFASKEED